MLASVVCTLIVAKRRSLTQLFPESLAHHWVLWELRALVSLSVSLQAALIIFGNRRKYRYQLGIRLLVWLFYQAADWLPTFSLSLLLNGQDDCKKISIDSKYAIMAFWAPIFLLQIGTPDTITAYSLEDNELWTRKGPSIVFQFLVAIYSLIRSWDSKPVNFLTIPMLVAALVKFGEKMYVQYMASRDQFRDSMLTSPDPGPNYAKFMDAYSAKKAEGFDIRRGPLIEIPMEEEEEEPPLSTATSIEEIDLPYEEILKQGYDFFESFKRLFADLILSFQDYRTSRSFFRRHSSKVAFKVIEIELGFVYDVLYTKANVIYSSVAIFLRPFSLSLPVSVLCAFCICYRNKFSEIDVIITCIVLVGVVLLEIYQVVLFLSSDRMNLIRLGRKFPLVSCLQRLHLVPANKRWSDHVAQYNLLSFCIKENSTTRNKVHKWFHEKLEKYRYTNQAVSSELKELVFQQLLEKSTGAKDMKGCRELCGCRGGRALKKEGMDFLDELQWTVEVEFDQSILLWHIATDLLYVEDLKENQSSVENSECKISKVLSDYMVYLQVIQPSMLPNGIGLIRFRDTCAEAIEFLQEWKYIKDVNQACSELFLVNSTEVLPSDVKGDRSKSVLFDGCRLAKTFQSFVKKRQLNNDKKWEILSHVWVEIMCYAASHCQAQNHSKQLPVGGELLTHVWLLMAHLGISEQFQIAQGHGRVKMLVS